MELPGYDLGGRIASTPYAEVHRATRTDDGTPVRVELLRATGPAVAERLAGAAQALRQADGRHLVRVRQVLDAPLALVRDDVPAEPWDGADPLRVVAEALDALARLHALGLVHGALTAQDLLLDTSVPLRPVVRVTGWGLAALSSPVPPDPADDVRDAGLLLEQLAGSLPPQAAAMTAADPAARPTAAQARDVLRQLRGMPAAPPSDRSHRRRPLQLAGAVLGGLTVLGLGVLGGRLLATGGGEPGALPQVAPSAPPPAEPYVLRAIARPDGLVVERSWQLEEGGAVLRGTTVVRNPTLRALSAGVDEVIPKSVADDVDDLAFTPGPDAVVERDPIVRFNVRGVPAAGSTTWTFVVRLPAPVQQEALPGLAADAEAARVAYEQRLAALRAAASRSRAPGAPAPAPTS